MRYLKIMDSTESLPSRLISKRKHDFNKLLGSRNNLLSSPDIKGSKISEIIRVNRSKRAQGKGSWKVMPKDSWELYRKRRKRRLEETSYKRSDKKQSENRKSEVKKPQRARTIRKKAKKKKFLRKRCIQGEINNIHKANDNGSSLYSQKREIIGRVRNVKEIRLASVTSSCSSRTNSESISSLDQSDSENGRSSKDDTCVTRD